MGLLDKFRRGPGCWLWDGYISEQGYGRYGHGESGAGRQAHRLVYQALVGPVPKGMDLDHLCRNRRCVNPAHLEPVTRKENLLRGQTIPAANAAKDCCKRGHPFDDANTYIRPDGKGRDCRACRREAEIRRSARRKSNQPAMSGRIKEG